jgi:hypothetical protein
VTVWPIRRPRRTRPILLVSVLVIAVLLLCVLGRALTACQAEQAGAAMRDATRAFVGHLESGEYDAAHHSMCVRSQDDTHRADFAAALAGRPKVIRYRLLETSVLSSRRGEVKVQLDFADGTTQTRDLNLVREGNTWKVCGYP